MERFRRVLPDAAEDLKAGIQLLRQGHNQEANAKFRAVLAADPSNQDAYNLVKETDYKVFDPSGKDFQVTFEDPTPISGENRYYVRVEQSSGNMAWASPVGVTMKR